MLYIFGDHFLAWDQVYKYQSLSGILIRADDMICRQKLNIFLQLSHTACDLKNVSINVRVTTQLFESFIRNLFISTFIYMFQFCLNPKTTVQVFCGRSHQSDRHAESVAVHVFLRKLWLDFNVCESVFYRKTSLHILMQS